MRISLKKGVAYVAPLHVKYILPYTTEDYPEVRCKVYVDKDEFFESVENPEDLHRRCNVAIRNIYSLARNE
jgi:hypothetical protein